jgi:RimJ/RimL family protein N-acetyltransferase
MNDAPPHKATSEAALPIGPRVDGPAASRPGRTTLQGRAVKLTPIDPRAHGDALYEAINGEAGDRLWHYLFEGPFADRATFDAHLQRIAASEDPLFFAILDKASESAVGYASYLRIEPLHRVIEVGNILYTPRLQQTTLATEAMYLMARHVFEGLGYRRYEWKCNALNAPSRRAALRFGFTFEGIFRQHMIVKGRNRDTAWFSMLDSEWPVRKANFDAEGKQKKPLGRRAAPGR